MPACIIFGVENLLQDGKIHLGPGVFKLKFSFLVWEEFSTVRVENFEVVLISRFSWVADATKIIHVEGGINTREIF